MDDDPLAQSFVTQAQAAAHLRGLGFKHHPDTGWIDLRGHTGSVTKVRDRWYACVYVEESTL